MTAADVRDEAARLVDRHAARLGMDQLAADLLLRLIRAIPVDEEEQGHGKPE